MILQPIPQPWLFVVNFYLFGVSLTFFVTVLLAIGEAVPISRIFIYPLIWPCLAIRLVVRGFFFGMKRRA